MAQDTPVRLIGDPMRLRQVCLNLLVNAIKFTDKGQILLRVEPEPSLCKAGGLRFCVTDSGPGIPPGEQQRIFSRFARTAAQIADSREGSGLGLEISKRLVEAMGGRIWVESVPGTGSTFYFTCQMEVQRAAEHDSLEKSRLNGIRMLVIDDNAATRTALGEVLSGAGVAVSLCAGPARARLELSRAHRSGSPYDAILLDAEMPPDDGIELASEFYAHDRERTVMMLTRDDLAYGLSAIREAGLGRYLLKPVKRIELLAAVANIAAGGQTEDARPADRPAASRDDHPRACRILLADDSEDNRLLIAAYLRNTPHRLETAENGRVAAEMFENRRYDLVLLDLNMPVMGGYAAVMAMRAWERERGASQTPILALTGRAMAEDRVRSIEAGCNGHLTKPISREVLIEAVSRFTDTAPRD